MSKFPPSNLVVCLHGYFQSTCRHCAEERGEPAPPPRRKQRHTSPVVYRNWRTGSLDPDCEPYPGGDQ